MALGRLDRLVEEARAKGLDSPFTGIDGIKHGLGVSGKMAGRVLRALREDA